MNKSFLILIFAVAFNNPLNAMFEVISGTGFGGTAGATAGAFFGPPGLVIGAGLGMFAGGLAMANAAEEEYNERKRKEQEELAEWKNQREAEKEKWVRRQRIIDGLYSSNGYELFGVGPTEKLAFEEYEQGKQPLVIAGRPFSDNQSQAIEELKGEIRQRLLVLNQELGRAVYGPTGQFVELTPAYKAALQARIQNPQTESLCTRLKNSDFALIGKKLKELGVASSLFWKKSDAFESELTAVVAHIIDASVNAYALPLQEKLQQEQETLRKEQQALAIEQTAHYETRRERTAAIIGQCNALSQFATVSLEKSNLLREKQKLQNDLEGVEVAIEFLNNHLQQIKDENAQMQREIIRSKRRSIERREQIAAQDARIAKLEKDLKESRDAFASCTLSK